MLGLVVRLTGESSRQKDRREGDEGKEGILVNYLSEVSNRLGYTLYTISKGRNTKGNYKRRTGAVPDLSSVAGLPQATAVSRNKGNYGISSYGVKEGTRMEGSIKSVRYLEVMQRARV